MIDELPPPVQYHYGSTVIHQENYWPEISWTDASILYIALGGDHNINSFFCKLWIHSVLLLFLPDTVVQILRTLI